MSSLAPSHTFAGNPLDRASGRRGDSAYIEALMQAQDTLVLPLWNGQPLVEAAPDSSLRLAYIDAALTREIAAGDERRLFMGLWKRTAVFAIDLEGSADPAEGPLNGLGRFEDLRSIALTLPAAEAGIAATAKAMFEWRRRHGFCAACGARSHPADAGWKRVCPACKAEHFPRTDPVAIMLAVQKTDIGERCLLGRQAVWPKGMWSAMAGFVEPGESIEEACARELYEEAGVTAIKVRYHSTQPWPYPSSLMVGMIAEIAPGDAAPNDHELEAVRWFTRTDARALLAGTMTGAFAPPKLAIAHHLIRAWAEEG